MYSRMQELPRFLSPGLAGEYGKRTEFSGSLDVRKLGAGTGGQGGYG